MGGSILGGLCIMLGLMLLLGAFCVVAFSVMSLGALIAFTWMTWFERDVARPTALAMSALPVLVPAIIAFELQMQGHGFPTVEAFGFALALGIVSAGLLVPGGMVGVLSSRRMAPPDPARWRALAPSVASLSVLALAVSWFVPQLEALRPITFAVAALPAVVSWQVWRYAVADVVILAVGVPTVGVEGALGFVVLRAAVTDAIVTRSWSEVCCDDVGLRYRTGWWGFVGRWRRLGRDQVVVRLGGSGRTRRLLLGDDVVLPVGGEHLDTVLFAIDRIEAHGTSLREHLGPDDSVARREVAALVGHAAS